MQTSFYRQQSITVSQATYRKRTLIMNEPDEAKLIWPRNMGRYIAILTILCLTTFYCGYCLAYITALGQNNVSMVYGKVTKEPVVKAFLISSLPFGVFFGTFLNPWVLPLVSRRNLTLIMSIMAEILEFIIQIRLLSVFFVVRFLQGTLTGLFLVLIPAYVRQISPKQINKRGIFGIFAQLFVIIGFMVAFGINTIMLESGVDQLIRWRLVISLNFFAILFIIIGIITKLIPQSPNSLISKGKTDEAKIIIAMFYRQRVVQQVYQQKLKEIQDAKKPSVFSTKDRPIIYTILTFEIPIMHQMTGVNAYISQMGFITAIFNNKFGDYVPFMMGSIQVLTALYTLVYLTKVSRKTLVLVGNLGMSLCCIGIGISYQLTDQYQEMYWVIVALIVIFMGLHGATLVPGVWTYIPQIATKQEIRWSQVVGWFFTGTSVALFIYIGQTFGYGPIFFAFGGFTLICFIFNSIFMIEIKPKLKDLVNIELKKMQFNMDETDEDRQDDQKQ